MRVFPRRFSVAFVLFFYGFTTAKAEMVIEVTEGVEDSIPIAIVPFGIESGAAAPPVDIGQVIRSDLARSGRFSSLAPADMLSRPTEFSAIRFDDWRRLGMDNLIIGKVRANSLGEYEIEFRLVDVFKGAQMDGYKVMSGPDDLRLAAHRIADTIYERLTGERGAFSTRISYVTVEKGADGKAEYALQLADADGYGPRTLLTSAEPILSPAWSPDGTRLAYVSFEGRNSAIYVQDIATGNRERVAAGPGLNSAPAWSPDGARLAMTLSRDGDPEIYVLNLAGRRLRRITHNTAIDTEPAWSPDGRKLVFTSDRGGSPQLYEVALDGGTPRRLTVGMGNYNARGSYSPDGSMITLVHSDGSGYHIAVLDLKRRDLTVLTDSRLDESPTFAPNGRMIMYATVGARGTELAATSVDGRVKQRLALLRGEVREPAWGPFRN